MAELDGNKKEMSMEIRLLIAFLLMGAVLFVTPYFYKPQPAPQPQKKQPTTAAAAPEPAKPAASKPAEAPLASEGPLKAAKEETHAIETDLYRVEFSNRGGVILSWVLKKYRDGNGKPVELVNTTGAAKAMPAMSFDFKDDKPPADLNQALYAVRKPDAMSIEFEFSDGKAVARKSFRFRRDAYIVDVGSQVSSGGKSMPHYLVWRGGFGDQTAFNAASTQHTVFFDVANNKLVVHSAGDGKDGPVIESGNFSFAGIEDVYFAAVFLPASASAPEIKTLSDSLIPQGESKAVPHAGVAVGGTGALRAGLFVGPKDVDILKAVDARLSRLIDYGWFFFIAEPLFKSLHWVNHNLANNWGWAIVIVTLIINILMLPLKFTSLKSMKKMQVLQPHIAAINEKYRNVGMRDPKKQEQNQEVMALYKKHGVNPMGGCMPMVLQIPFFIAFYKVLSVSIELRGASWLWVGDLSQPEKLAVRVLPVAMLATQFILQKMTPATTADPAQQRIMLIMPLVLGFMFYNVQSGLVLYWLTGNLVGIAQQLVFNRLSHAPPVEAAVQPKKKRGSRN